MDPEEMIDVLSRAALTPMPTVPCPHCDRGTETGPNGESWRCGTCNGYGRIPAEAGRRLGTMSETTHPDPQPQPDVEPPPEADPTAPEPEPQPDPSEPGEREPEDPEQD